MKRMLNKTWRSFVALLLVFSMVLGVSGNLCVAAVEAAKAEDKQTINYVSLGDSMTNGYGLEGYEPVVNGEHKNVNGYMQEVENSYPVNFKSYLETIYGEGNVDLTQLATSATRADDTLYLLTYGTEDEIVPDDYTVGNVPSRFREYYALNNSAVYNGGREAMIKDLAETFQTSVAEADVISVGVGSNNFSTFLTRRIGYYVGAMAPSFGSMFGSMYDVTDLPGLLEGIDPELKEIATKVQTKVSEAFMKEMSARGVGMDYVLGKHPDSAPADIAGKDLTVADFIGGMAETTAYTTVSYLVSYKGIIDHILKVNPDAQIVLVGLSNWLNGMNIELFEGMEPIPFGKLLDYAYEAVNVYMAALPALYEGLAYVNEEEFTTKIYYAEVGDVELLAEQMAEEHEIPSVMTRRRMVRDVVGNILSMMGDALGAYPTSIDVEDVDTYAELSSRNEWPALNAYFQNKYMDTKIDWNLAENYTNPQAAVTNMITSCYISCVGYLGIEKAFLNTVDLQTFPVGTFIILATEGEGGLQDTVMKAMSGIDMSAGVTPDHIYDVLVSTPELQGLCNIFAIYVAGDGVLCHPSIAGHKQVSDAMINAVENDITATDVTIENLIKAAEILADLVAEYYDEAYAYAYDYAEENGYIDILVEGLDTADKALADIDVDAIPLSEEFTEEFKEKLEESIANARETIAQAKKLVLEADQLDQASLDELLALLDTLLVNVTDVAELLEIAAVDTYNDVMPILIDALIKLRDQAVKQLTIAIQKGTEWLMNKAQEAFDAFVKALMEALPVADQYLYDWFYNNPDKVVGFFYEYGDDMGAFMEEHYQAFLAVIGYIGYTFGDEILEFVMENPDTVLKAMVNWYETYGERTWAMIDRYAEYLGLYDYLEEVKEQLEEAYAKAEAEVKAEIAKAMAQIEEELAQIRGLIEEAIRESAEEAEKVILEKLEELGEAIEELIAKIEALLEEAVSAEYIPTVDSKYVAIGDSSVTGKGAKEAVVPYAERLAEELELRADQYVNLGLDGATTADLFAVVEDNADELKDADLITVGLSVNAMLTEALDAAKADELPEYDWSTYLPEEAVVYIEEKLAEVEAELSTNESLAKYAPMMTSVVEGLGYNYVEFAFEYPELVNRIHELAAEDAQVIMVGMYNPMEGLELADINIGEYVDYITRLANIHLTAYSLITPDTVYVDAPDVDTFAEHTEYKNEYLFLLNFVNGNHIKAQFATAEGHEYIKDQILDRMDIIRLWGDVNRDGKVNSKDAVAILRYVIRLVDASELDLTVGDLNADGKVSSKDAVLILQYCIKMITKFPVEA